MKKLWAKRVKENAGDEEKVIIRIWEELQK